jgi:hypothetical protein
MQRLWRITVPALSIKSDFRAARQRMSTGLPLALGGVAFLTLFQRAPTQPPLPAAEAPMSRRVSREHSPPR